MAFSSIRLSPLYLQPTPFSRRFLQLRAELSLSISSSLHPSRSHSRRKNHLRPKIPNIPLPPNLSPPPRPPPSHEHIDSSSYADDRSLLIVEKVGEANDTVASFDVSNAFIPGASHRWYPGLVLDLGARFAILLAVQTAVAVWFLSKENVEELGRGNNEDAFKSKEEVIGAEKEMLLEDSKRMVAEIREMASEARRREAEGNVGGRIEEDEENKGVAWRKKSIARIYMDGQEVELVPKKKPKKLKLRNLGVGYFPKGKGFGGSKPIHSGRGIDKGGLPQIAYLNPAKESKNHRTHTKSGAQSCNVNPRSFKNEEIERVPEELPYVDNRHVPSEMKIEESRCSENSISNDSTDSGAKDSQKLQESSMILTTKYGTYKESMHSSPENQWWIKLPYLFGIFLHRGYENRDKGLYSLPISSAAQDGKQHSYTITFQDRGDAMNFSFLLESFFEDLGDVRADIVPLTIRELDVAIRSGEMKLIIARKGQLRLYAGQPLVEVENALRSLLE